jgi:hypothetical protein
MVANHGANIDAKDHDGHKAICLAAQEGQVEILRYLLDHCDSLGRKAEILMMPCVWGGEDKQKHKHRSLLVHAIHSESLPSLRFLTNEVGIDCLEPVDSLIGGFGHRKTIHPHQFAILYGKFESFKWFHTEGRVPIELGYKGGQTGIHLSCMVRDTPESETMAFIRFLVEEMHQKNIGVRDEEGKEAADYALAGGRRIIHRYLTKAEERVRKEEEAAKAQEAAPKADAAAAVFLRELEEEEAAKQAQQEKKAAKKAAAKKKRSSAAGGGGGGGAVAARAGGVAATTAAMADLALVGDAKAGGDKERKEREEAKEQSNLALSRSPPPPSPPPTLPPAAPEPAPAPLSPTEDWLMEGAPADFLCPISLGRWM